MLSRREEKRFIEKCHLKILAFSVNKTERIRVVFLDKLSKLRTYFGSIQVLSIHNHSKEKIDNDKGLNFTKQKLQAI